MKNRMTEVFRERFGTEPLLVRSPGRVNIIGEHTDYNEGFVLPAAIDRYIYIAISRRDDREIHLYSRDFAMAFETSLAGLAPVSLGWPNYILGVVDQLQKKGCLFSGFNLLVDGDVPMGAGLSSSAAVECATVFALNELFSLGLPKRAMATIAQQAEHHFAGVRCGIMDQFASLYGKKDHAIQLDCRTLEYRYVPLDLKGYKMVLLNTQVKHNLAASEYNTRRAQCEQGLAWVQEYHPLVKSLRDVTPAMLETCVGPKDALVFRRCRYVVEENRRLLAGCDDLVNGDLPALGRKMFQTHKGLSEDFGVSCRELDFLVKAVDGYPGVAGARMMGGGFGGCTINLVREDALECLVDTVSKSYKEQMGLELAPYIVQTANGSEILSLHEHATV